jgi:hypothetical protein
MITRGRPLHKLIETYAARDKRGEELTVWIERSDCRQDTGSDKTASRGTDFKCDHFVNCSLIPVDWIMARVTGLFMVDTNAH